MTITEQIQSTVRTVIENFQGNQINIALSGGVDSVVLAHAASRVSHESLYCLHVNHGISDNAEKWESFCFEFCKQIGAKFKSKQFHLKGVNNLESVARDCRYEFFIENLSDGDVLLTAHHMDDQAETFLLRLMRGAGVDGLASMRPTRDLGNGILARPLLGYSKDELMAYATENDLKWVEDESNQSSDYDRNFLRNEVLPLLRTRWGNASSSISKSASLCQLASEMNAEKANEWLKNCSHKEKEKLIVNDFVKNLDGDSQTLLVRAWLKSNGYQAISSGKTAYLIERLNGLSSNDTKFTVEIEHQTKIMFFDNALHIVKDNQRLAVSFLPAKKGDVGISIEPTDLEDSVYKGSLKFRFKGCNRTLKKFLQEQRVPSWEREKYPIKLFNGEVVTVGEWVSDLYLSNEPKYRPILTKD